MLVRGCRRGSVRKFTAMISLRPYIGWEDVHGMVRGLLWRGVFTSLTTNLDQHITKLLHPLVVDYYLSTPPERYANPGVAAYAMPNIRKISVYYHPDVATAERVYGALIHEAGHILPASTRDEQLAWDRGWEMARVVTDAMRESRRACLETYGIYEGEMPITLEQLWGRCRRAA